MKEEISLALIFFSIIGIIAAFYYAASALINIVVGIYRIVGYGRISAVPFMLFITGIIAGLIVSIYFRWIPIWSAFLIAIIPDVFYICGSLILGLRMKNGFVPKDRNPSTTG